MHMFYVDIHLITFGEMLATFFTINHTAPVAVKMFAFLEGFRTLVAGIGAAG